MPRMIEVQGIVVQEPVRGAIEIEQYALIDHVENLIREKYPKPAADSYIDDKGFWQIFAYTHPHNGDDEYRRGRRATPEELKVQEHIDFLHCLRFWSLK